LHSFYMLWRCGFSVAPHVEWDGLPDILWCRNV
jgi:hypothetical protein